MTTEYQRQRWSDAVDEEDTDYSYLLLPKPEVTGPDKDGIKKTVEYYFNDAGQTVTTTRVTKLGTTRVSNAIERRKSWVKFGDAVHDNAADNLTVVSREVIAFERPNAPGTKAEDSNASSSDPLASNSGILMHCRSCGKKGEHWTARCPLKDLAQPSESVVENPTSKNPSTTSEPGAPKGTYVPPTKRGDAMRPVAPGADMRRRNDENSVRVNNLSEDTREADLNELFSPFGSVSRVYVVMDHKTCMSRGFGFVNFVRREDGERAIAKLNGYGYDNLILRVEWAAPRAN
ncbi:eukaryotic translation initiation factor 3 subunit G-like protein [Tanacetum coccineum]